MTFKEFLHFPLIQTSKMTIDVMQLIGVAVIILAIVIVNRLIHHLLMRRVSRQRISKEHALTMYHLFRYIIWIVGILFALQHIGLNLNVLIASSAALAVGIGFGMQQIFKDLISGIFILFEGNIRVDNIMQIDGNTIGRVHSIGIRTTEILTAEGVTIIVPNSQFLSDRVINWSRNNAFVRTSVSVGVSYDSDVDLVKATLIECVKQHAQVLKDKEPFVRFADFASSSMNFSVFFWVNDTTLSEPVKSDIRFAICEAFRRKGISIPFPQQEIAVTMKN